MAKTATKPYKKSRLIFGIGINDADYATQPNINGNPTPCPFYSTWVRMLRRCYSDGYLKKYPTYNGTTVCKEWLSFMNFRSWMVKQNWRGLQLDKDIITPGNKIYSSSNCAFVSSKVNNIIIDSGAARGQYPQGVCSKGLRKFVACCSVNRKNKHLGCFDTPEEASIAYRKFKSNHIINLANEQDDIRVKNGLILHAKLMMV